MGQSKAVELEGADLATLQEMLQHTHLQEIYPQRLEHLSNMEALESKSSHVTRKFHLYVSVMQHPGSKVHFDRTTSLLQLLQDACPQSVMQ